MSSSPDECDRCYRQARVQIDAGQYEEAIISCDRALEYNPNAHEVWVLRGYAFDSLKRYKQALASYEKALEIQKEIGDLQAQAKTLSVMIHLYPFNGKVREGFLAQQQWIETIKQLDLSPGVAANSRYNLLHF
jgi:tetratricopeptide (TPR) repeat protein